MRLSCPNCDAQYEVPESAIPAGGRDVQCSNCGHFWYQMPLGAAEEDEAAAPHPEDIPPAPTATPDEGVAAGSATDPWPQDPDDRLADAPDSAATGWRRDPDDPEPAAPAAVTPTWPQDPDDGLPDAPVATGWPRDPDDPEDEAPAPVAAAAVAAARPKSLDDALVALLKEEAEREVEARKADPRYSEAPMPETQGDLGLPPPDESQDRARRLAALQGEDAASAPSPARPAARRDLLPDVEAINSTLQSSEVEARQAEAEVASLPDLTQPRRGFRSGFSLSMLVLVAGVSAYAAAPQLKAQFPGMAPTLDAYVGAVDSGRQWLDGMMNRASSAIAPPPAN